MSHGAHLRGGRPGRRLVEEAGAAPAGRWRFPPKPCPGMHSIRAGPGTLVHPQRAVFRQTGVAPVWNPEMLSAWRRRFQRCGGPYQEVLPALDLDLPARPGYPVAQQTPARWECAQPRQPVTCRLIHYLGFPSPAPAPTGRQAAPTSAAGGAEFGEAAVDQTPSKALVSVHHRGRDKARPGWCGQGQSVWRQ
jgi:hypothetical protein